MVTKKATKATKTTAAKPKKTAAGKSSPSFDDIRKKAEEIYFDRISKGLEGTSEDDWHTAEKILKARKK